LLTEYASGQDFSRQFYPGLQVYGSYPADQYPRPQYQGPPFSRHRFPGPKTPPFVPAPKPPGPPFSEEDLVCLVGADLEVPYPLYKQISDSFLSTDSILVLCPNNTIVQVQGYSGLKDITQDDPDNTKVIISSESMIPAPIYLRIVLIQPEEVMLRLPDGQILPHQLYLEKYGKKPETQDLGGQTYYEPEPQEDSVPFLVENNKKSDFSDGRSLSSFIPNLSNPTFSPDSDVPSIVPVLYEPRPYSTLKPHPQYPEPISAPRHLEPVLTHRPRPDPVLQHSELVSVPRIHRSHTAAQHAESQYNKPRRLDFGPAPYNFDHSSRQQLRRSAAFPLYPGQAPWSYYPRPSQPGQVVKPIEPQRPASEQKTFLPAGVHVIETSRCSICDPNSSNDGAHVTVFSV